MSAVLITLACLAPSAAFTRPTRSLRSTQTVKLRAVAAAARETTPIFPFATDAEATVALWERIDDVVMGGVSSSKVVATEGGGAEWRGIVRTDGGGFCGTRTATLAEPMDLSAYEGVYVDAALVSDNDVARRAWKMTIRTGASRGEVVHSAEWTPMVGVDGVRGPSFIPFEDFKLVRGPRLVEGAPPLNASACATTYGFGLTISKFGAARAGGTPVVENFRDGPFAVKLNAVGAYGAAAAAAPRPQLIGAGGSTPNSPGSPIKSNGLVLGAALAVLRPVAKLVFSEGGRRRSQARKQLVAAGKAGGSWGARRYGQRVVKPMRGLSPVAAAAEGLKELARDALVSALALPLRLAFRTIFTIARIVRKLQGKKPMPAL